MNLCKLPRPNLSVGDHSPPQLSKIPLVVVDGENSFESTYRPGQGQNGLSMPRIGCGSL